ncbi:MULTISPECIES: hypothetical protein [unclassified Caballeronia]|uniref:hypothetical protein n=1 Tax=unclassified Caballeronia TaxID=2646786 RepID=UPI0028605607|nr:MULTISPECIES: hypothetical protein [unclassified Caballeronia]MDR5750365.1 hypothetical protein [Caballeronia sp. LZ024]MDR5842603.1 hypothetical protein [Caballeronia sp. LZ031]
MSEQQKGHRVAPRLLAEDEYVGVHSASQEFAFETFMFHIQRAYLEHGFPGVVSVSEKMAAAANAYGINETRDTDAVCALLNNGYDNLLDVSKAA